jgi:hypothetical protein
MLLALSVHIVLALQPTSGISEVALRYAVDEVARIWARYNVVIDGPVDPSAPVALGSKLITVDATSLPSRPKGTSRPLGLIEFDAAGVPMPAVAINYGGLLQLVSGLAFLGRREWQWPYTLRDRLIGRALGRVLAHELGHFLLASKRHSTAGLMRSDHRITELVTSDDDAFRLDEADRTRLARLGAGDAAVAAGTR